MFFCGIGCEGKSLDFFLKAPWEGEDAEHEPGEWEEWFVEINKYVLYCLYKSEYSASFVLKEWIVILWTKLKVEEKVKFKNKIKYERV